MEIDKINYKNDKIHSDFHLLLILLKDLFLYFLLLIPNIVLCFFSFFSKDENKSSRYFEKIFLEPFNLVIKILAWFFEAQYTAYMIIVLIFVFFLQVVFLSNYPELLNKLTTHTLHLFEGNYYSIFTAIFLHGSIVHLLTNCIALLIFGRIVEKELDYKVTFLFLFSGILSNIISNLISYYLEDYFFSLGASGAIAGIMIFAIMLNPFAITSLFLIPLPVFILGWFFMYIDFISLGQNSQTNHLAHLIGYSTLLLFFFFFELKNRKKIMKGLVVNIVLIILSYFLFNIFNEQINLLSNYILNLL